NFTNNNGGTAIIGGTVLNNLGAQISNAGGTLAANTLNNDGAGSIVSNSGTALNPGRIALLDGFNNTNGAAYNQDGISSLSTTLLTNAATSTVTIGATANGSISGPVANAGLFTVNGTVVGNSTFQNTGSGALGLVINAGAHYTGLTDITNGSGTA